MLEAANKTQNGAGGLDIRPVCPMVAPALFMYIKS